MYGMSYTDSSSIVKYFILHCIIIVILCAFPSKLIGNISKRFSKITGTHLPLTKT